MKKILFVVTDRKTGGVSMVLEDILNNLSDSKYKIDLFILNNEGEMIEGRINPNINIIYGGKFFKAIDTSLSYFKKHFDLGLLFSKIRLMILLKTGLITKRLKKERNILNSDYDIEVAFKDGFPVLVTNAGNTPKKIHWLHSNYGKKDPTRRYRKTFIHAYDDFYKIVAVSKETAIGFNSHYHCENKTIIIKNIVDSSRIEKNAMPCERLSDKEINFISVGRLNHVKGYDRLFRAILRLKNEGLFTNCHLTIVGGGEEWESLNNFIVSNDLDCVTLIGNVSNPYKYVKGADVYVSSSYEESFGLVMIEALILGVPVLATKTAATDVIFENGVNGWTVDNSEDGIYNGLKRLINDDNFRNELIKNAKNYDYSSINKEIISSIENIFDS